MSKKGDSAYYHNTSRCILDYFETNNVPVNLIYNDGSEEPVYIISYDNYNIICQDLDKNKFFMVLKHRLKKIETEIKLEGVIEKDRNKKHTYRFFKTGFINIEGREVV